MNCCTDDCPKTVKFTDATGISFKKSADVTHDYFSQIEIGMKKADGSYFNNAAEFCKYMVDGIKQEMTNLRRIIIWMAIITPESMYSSPIAELLYMYLILIITLGDSR